MLATSRRHLDRRRRPWLVAVIGFGLAVASCDQSGESIGTPDGETGLTPLELDPGSGTARTYTFPALGGLRFEVDQAHDVYAIGDRVMVDPTGSRIGTFSVGAAYLGLTTQAADGTRIDTVDDFMGQLDFVDDLQVLPNGRFVEVFGRRLVGYSVDRETGSGSASGSVEDTALTVFSSTRHGAPGLHAWAPQRAELYVGETPTGVLYAGYSTAGNPGDPVARPAFDRLLSTAVLTGPGLDAALTAGTTFVADGPNPQPAEVSDTGPEPLRVAFGEVAPGVYQLPNFGQQISVEIRGWRAQPNQPGVVVLTTEGSAGPGDRGVVFIGGLDPQLVPLAGGPAEAGDPVDLSRIDTFLEDPPSNLVVSDVERTSVGGLPAIRFDVAVADDVSCAQNEPCEYAFATTWDWSFAVSIRAETAHRIWWIPEHPTGVAMIHVADPDPTFLDHATDLVASIETLT